MNTPSSADQNNRFGIPTLPATFPARQNPLLQKTAAFLFWLWGWQFEGNLPQGISKAVVIGAPHTSNWDFIIAMIAIFGLNVRISIMGKHTIFVWPFRRLLHWMGLVPTDRRAANGLVGSAIAEFEQRSQFVLGVAPEGTRSKVHKWRTGFYHIAHGANVPIVPVGLDFGNKRIKIGAMVWPTGELEQDMVKIQAFYADVVGKRPNLG